MPVRTAGALVFLLLLIEQHNTFSFWSGYQINPKIWQNILYSHCFMSQNTCFSFLNSGTAHHFLFLSKKQHTTFSFWQNHGWSFLNQSFARFMIGKNQWLIGYQISLIVIAWQPKYHRFYALVYLQLSSLLSKLWSVWGTGQDGGARPKFLQGKVCHCFANFLWFFFKCFAPGS